MTDSEELTPHQSIFRSTGTLPIRSPSRKNKLQRTRSMDAPQHLAVWLPTSGSGESPNEAVKSPKKEWKNAEEEISLRNFSKYGGEFTDTLHQKSISPVVSSNASTTLPFVAAENRLIGGALSKDQLLREAVEFIDQYYAHIQRAGTIAHQTRLAEVRTYVEDTGKYCLTEAELIFGARLAWRNLPTSVARVNWINLKVFDARKVMSTREMYDAICRHLLYALNGGTIKCAVTVFPQTTNPLNQFRIWNPQLLGYAGYKDSDGHVTGDLGAVEFTKICTSLGWSSDRRRYDVLPLVLQANGSPPELFELPQELVMELSLCHPEHDSFEDLDLKCCVIPSTANQGLEIGGLVFPACPMNEVYTDSQLCQKLHLKDEMLVKDIAFRLDIDTNADRLWRERAYLEANTAVLHSFKRQGVLILDHYSALEDFRQFFEDEHLLRGGCPTDVTALENLISSSGGHFDQEALCYILKPTFLPQTDPWKKDTGNSQSKIKIQVIPSLRSPTKPEVKPLPKLEELEPPITAVNVPETGQESKKLSNGPSTTKSKDANFESPEPVKPISKLYKPAQYSKETPKPLPLPTPQSLPQSLAKNVKATILFATQTGKAQRFASKAFDLLSRAVNTRMLRMDEYNVKDLSNEDLVIVIASTAQNSQPPSNGEKFCQDLFELARNNDIRVPESLCCERFSSMNSATTFMKKSSSKIEGPLDKMKFSVFGLGSSLYSHLCPFAWAVDTIFEKLGGERLVECGEGDDIENIQTDFEKWLSATLQVISETYQIVNKIGTTMNFSKNQIAAAGQDWGSSHFRIYTETKDAEGATLCESLSELHNKTVRPCQLIARKNLLASDSGRTSFLIRLSSKGDEDLRYQPGDVIAVFPANENSQAERILRSLDYHKSPDAIFKLEKLVSKDTRLGRLKVWTSVTRLPTCSVRMALSRYLDITTPPSPDLLRLLATRASEPKDRERLLVLGMGGEDYEDWKLEAAPTIADILENFPSLRVPASLLLTQLPLLAPRHYSISSSPDLYSGEIHLTVTVVTYHKKGILGDIQRHDGVCSSWLHRIGTDDVIPGYIVRVPFFHMPQDDTVPMLLVATGTGIAPFRSFWQHRQAQLEQFDSAHDVPESDRSSPTFGDITLVFGCRKATIDELYKSDLLETKQQGVVTSAMVTFSREQSQQRQRYVQDVLRDHPWLVYSTICRRNGHFFVSGDVTMVKEVRATVEAILSQYGRMSMADSRNYVVRMKEESRYHENVFGLLLHVNDVIKQQRQDKKQPRVLVSRDDIKPVPLGIASKKSSISELAKKFNSGSLQRPPGTTFHHRRATATVLMPRYSKPLMIPSVERTEEENNNERKPVH